MFDSSSLTTLIFVLKTRTQNKIIFELCLALWNFESLVMTGDDSDDRDDNMWDPQDPPDPQQRSWR